MLRALFCVESLFGRVGIAVTVVAVSTDRNFAVLGRNRMHRVWSSNAGLVAGASSAAAPAAGRASAQVAAQAATAPGPASTPTSAAAVIAHVS